MKKRQMTEKLWNTCENPAEMIRFLMSNNPNERKMRLFACACCRLVEFLVHDQKIKAAIDVAEMFADGLVSNEARARLEAEMHAAMERLKAEARTPEDIASVNAVTAIAYSLNEEFDIAEMNASGNSGGAIASLSANRKSNRIEQVSLIRDIFNPFGERTTWTFSPKAKSIAKGIYENRAFNDIPILTKQLELDGYVKEEIVRHFKASAIHVKGCWALDTICEKAS